MRVLAFSTHLYHNNTCVSRANFKFDCAIIIQGHLRHNWKARKFVLKEKDPYVYYFKGSKVRFKYIHACECFHLPCNIMNTCINTHHDYTRLCACTHTHTFPID